MTHSQLRTYVANAATQHLLKGFQTHRTAGTVSACVALNTQLSENERESSQRRHYLSMYRAKICYEAIEPMIGLALLEPFS